MAASTTENAKLAPVVREIDSTKLEQDRAFAPLLTARDRVVDDWLRDQVGPAHDAVKADPSRGLTADQMRADLSPELVASAGRAKAEPGQTMSRADVLTRMRQVNSQR